jgi:hypothetical protein
MGSVKPSRPGSGSLAGRGNAHAAQPSRTHAAAAVGAGYRRLQHPSIPRAPARRALRRRERHSCAGSSVPAACAQTKRFVEGALTVRRFAAGRCQSRSRFRPLRASHGQIVPSGLGRTRRPCTSPVITDAKNCLMSQNVSAKTTRPQTGATSSAMRGSYVPRSGDRAATLNSYRSGVTPGRWPVEGRSSATAAATTTGPLQVA